VYNSVGAKKGFAYVDIYKTTDAKKIFENMHGSEILGRSVNIDDATRK
jgi:RNA recognition motif-containing protein